MTELRAKIAELYFKTTSMFFSILKKLFLIPYWNKHFKRIGKNVVIGKNCEFIYSHIEIGDDVFIGDRASFIASIAYIHIGNHVMFGPNVTIRGGNHRTDLIGRYMKDIKETEKLPENDEDVYIDDDVWIGCNVTILKGVHIGRGSVIGAGSVVVKDVAPYTIHVGCGGSRDFPRFSETQIKEHEQLLSNIVNREDNK